MMKGRSKPVHLVVDGLPAHKKANVRQYIESTQGKLSMHILPGYAPDLNPDELVWSHVKRTGVARDPRRAGEKLENRVDQQLRDMQKNRRLVRSFFQTPSVAYISDCCVTPKVVTQRRRPVRVPRGRPSSGVPSPGGGR